MISVIIPVLNEEKSLPDKLRQLAQQDGVFETIAIDGGSTDDTLNIVHEHTWLRVLSSSRGRAPQMNAGANVARGDWLLFLHADTILPDGALVRLDSLTKDTSIQAGGFRHRFSANRAGLRLISWLHNWRCSITHVFYGDQAFFIRRDLFNQLGGYPEDAEMEDIALGEAVRKETRPVLLNEYVVTDSRKFEQMGIWRSLSRIFVILMKYELGLSVAKSPFFSNIR